MNAGLAAISGPAVLLLNADCVLDGGFLAAARPRLDDPGTGSVAPLLLRATGMEPADRTDIVDAAGMTIDRRAKNSLVGHGEPRPEHARRRAVFGGDGACVLYRREALDAVAVGAEVFDEDMALWASDADLAWRVRNAGWRCVFEPEAVAWHVRFYSPGNRPLLAPEHRRLQFRNRLLMLAKNQTARGYARNAPYILGYEVLALGHALLRERTLLGGYVEAARLLGAARSRRRARPPQ
jgi:GT2 family glycosyltransferase